MGNSIPDVLIDGSNVIMLLSSLGVIVGTVGVPGLVGDIGVVFTIVGAVAFTMV
jgi:hypothetical protein